MVKRLALLGSTGSIGVNALDVVRRLNRGRNGGGREVYRVWGLSAQKNVRLLTEQIREFQPRVAVVSDPAAARELKAWARVRHPGLRVWDGTSGLERLASHPQADWVLSAVVGSVGLLPLLAAVRAGKTVALANKEALIVGGDLVMAEARKHGARLIPVDSEHSAIFQCIAGSAPSGGRPSAGVRRIVLTASGGAFYRWKGSLNRVTPAQALVHPTWKMGNKITIDCATLTNKGLEAIEAHHLFGVPLEDIQIVIHPQSIVHSLVEFTDGAVLAQLSHPDMRLPIQYALTHPARLPTPLKPLRLAEVGRLEFHAPDFRRFPCLGLALKAGRLGGAWPAVFNGANEMAVRAFLDGRISFLGIPKLLVRVMDAYQKTQNTRSETRKERASLKDILEADRWSRQKAQELADL